MSATNHESARAEGGARPAPEPAPPPAPVTDGELRRVLRVLSLSQVLSGAGLAAGITVGALLAEDMLGSTRLAGLPVALFTAGAAVGATLVGRVCERRGRRPGLALGHATAALGSVGVVAAAALTSVPLLLVSLVVYGAGTSTNLLARYAGADLAPPQRRGRAVSVVLLATTAGAVAGPNLVGPTGRVAEHLGVPALAGPFLLAAVAYTAGAAVLLAWLRPDPLLRARELAAYEEAPADADTAKGAAAPEGASPSGGGRFPGVVTGVSVLLAGQLVMIAVMAMTPVHMTHHGHGTDAVGLVIGVHVAAMFLPSPLTGLLVDRVGRLEVAAAAGGVLLLAGLVAAWAPPNRLPALLIALALLGIGWNMTLVSGTAILTDAAPLDRRARLQALADVGMSITGATGGMVSGLVVAGAGFPTLTLAAGTVAVLLIPLAGLSRARGPEASPG